MSDNLKVRIFTMGIWDDDTLEIRMTQERVKNLVAELKNNHVDVEWMTDDLCIRQPYYEGDGSPDEAKEWEDFDPDA